MRTFAYAPDVSAFVSTQDHGVIDLTPDIISGSVTRVENQVSSAEFTIQNPYNKYTRKIKPMDRITIWTQRIHAPLQIFTGYVDRAPYSRIFPGPVSITASCTLKRLLHTYFDPGLPFVTTFLQNFGWIYDSRTGGFRDPQRNLFDMDHNSGLGRLMVAVLAVIGNWPLENIQVQSLPDSFITKTIDVLTKQTDLSDQMRADLDQWLHTLMTVEGIDLTTGAQQFDLNDIYGSDYSDSNPLPSALAHTYHASIHGPPLSVGNIDITAINKLLVDSPMANLGRVFAEAGIKHGVNPALIVAIAAQESTFGKNPAPGTQYNPFGIRAGDSAWREFSSWADAIDYATSMIAGTPPSNNPYYFKAGKFTPQAIYLGTWCASGCETQALGYVLSALGLQLDQSAVYKGTTEPTSTLPAGQRGRVGDVTVGDQRFFTGTRVANQPFESTQGYTFKITNNPYQNDTMVFKATRFDPRLGVDDISIYVPGALDKGTAVAQAWTDHDVVLQTSQGREPFPVTPPAPFASSPVSTDPDTTKVIMAPDANTPNETTQLDANGQPFRVSQDVINFIAATAECYGKTLTITTGVNHVHLGSGSDHAYGDAADIDMPELHGSPGNVSPNLTKLGQCALITAGMPAAQAITKTGDLYNINGYQVIFNFDSPQAGDHYGHLHVGLGARPNSHRNGGTGNSTGVTLPVGTVPGAGTGSGVQGGMTGGAQALTVRQAEQISLSVNTGIEHFFPGASAESQYFTGERALANDIPLFDWIKDICTASGRSFMSLPNGDFLAYYPNYFGWANDVDEFAPYFVIQDIELIDLQIDISDAELTTHVFGAGDTYTPNQSIDLEEKFMSVVASVENAEAFNAFINQNGETFDSTAFLERYGARPLTVEELNIKHPLVLFLFTWNTFLEKWANQFIATVDLTFMPELYPGTLVEFYQKDLVMYVESVTHTFDRAGGFRTSATMKSPQSRGGINHNMVLNKDGLKDPVTITVTPPGGTDLSSDSSTRRGGV
jgi:hypothetical protein